MGSRAGASEEVENDVVGVSDLFDQQSQKGRRLRKRNNVHAEKVHEFPRSLCGIGVQQHGRDVLEPALHLA